MLRGANARRDRECQELEPKVEPSGRYKGREKEVAARMVNLQRAQSGETRPEQQKDPEGKAPEPNLPINDFQQFRIDQITSKLGNLSRQHMERVESYEKHHKNRKTLIEELERCLAA